jgi:hypothetical protein
MTNSRFADVTFRDVTFGDVTFGDVTFGDVEWLMIFLLLSLKDDVEINRGQVR